MYSSQAFNHTRIPAHRILARGSRNAYSIMHFGLNTFTDKEWGYGDESPACFNPSAFDARQIVTSCKTGGLSGIILVCKHHDGFCLWPTATSDYNISHSPYRGGRGDIVREMSEACAEFGLDFGVYLSPWDRHSREYGTPDYIRIYQEQLCELLTRYGKVFEVWFDGANGGDGYYGGACEKRSIDSTCYYDWQHTLQLVRDFQPEACIFGDVGADLRWAGNEKGQVDDNSFGSITFTPKEGYDVASFGCLDISSLPTGTCDGEVFMPPECDFPLRPGWFYHSSEDGQQKTVEELVQNYLYSVGCGGFFNVGIAPDKTGQLCAGDVLRLEEFGKTLERLFGHPIIERRRVSVKDGIAEIALPAPVSCHYLQLFEDITNGEAIREYDIFVKERTRWLPVRRMNAMGLQRIIPLNGAPAEAVRVCITDSSMRVSSIDIALH